MERGRTFVLVLVALLSFVGAVEAGSSAVTVSIIIPECQDGIDNDADLLIDYPDDPGCDSVMDDEEEDPVYQCSDGIDNDGDGDIDFPDDLGCDSAEDDDETGPTPVTPPIQPSTVPTGSISSGGSALAYVLGLIPGITGQIYVSGVANPGMRIVLVRGTEVISVGESGPDGRFAISLDGLVNGVQSLLIYAEDEGGIRSRALSLPVNIIAGAITSIAGVDLFVGFPGDSGRSLGDMNSDSKVNIVDFSIIAYWYFRPEPPPEVDLNGDGKIDLIDFSILAYNWTG